MAMARILLRLDDITADMDLDAFSEAWADTVKKVRAEHQQAEVRLCPTCKTKLPADANPRRIYCSDRCRKRASDYRRHGKPTLWTRRCDRCGKWFESHYRAAKWCSDRCRTTS